MCYSAQIWAEFRKFEREFGAVMNVNQYVRFFWERQKDGTWRKIPKRMKDAFADPRTEDERKIHDLIVEADAELARSLEAELFAQKKRLADAERALQTKITKKAQNEQRIARNKMEAAQRSLADLRRTERLPRDARIFPGQYVPVMILENGRRTLIPMRYQCRLPGWNEAMERKYPCTYNARRDNLAKSWSKLFGYRHGIMVVNVFYGMFPGTRWSIGNSHRVRRTRTWCLSLGPIRRTTCWSRACGHSMSAMSCTRLPPSRMSRRQRSRLRDTTAASFRSSPKISMLGSSPIPAISERLTPSSMTGTGHITNTGLRHDHRVLSPCLEIVARNHVIADEHVVEPPLHELDVGIADGGALDSLRLPDNVVPNFIVRRTRRQHRAQPSLEAVEHYNKFFGNGWHRSAGLRPMWLPDLSIRHCHGGFL
jgi:hypothetical protein